MGVKCECESVGVLAFHRLGNSANPRIYPWEATPKKQPTNLFVGASKKQEQQKHTTTTKNHGKEKTQ